jgi:exosortase/archaeosortase family protein
MKQKWLALSPALQFIIISVFAVVLWKILYIFLLQPSLIPDKYLTHFIGDGTAYIINLASPNSLQKVLIYPTHIGGDVLLARGKHGILTIGDKCNGLELMLIYAGLIILLPGKKFTKFLYCIVGIAVLLIVNMLRCAGLQWIYKYYPDMFETTHHYLFTLVMYAFIFAGWSTYINKEKIKERLNAEG